MTANRTDQRQKSQSDKFKEAARDLECDEDEKRWDERLKKVAKGKLEPDKDDASG